MAHEEAQFIRGPVPFPAAPTVTTYSPSGVAYLKVTPSANTLKTMVRPRTVSQSLIYAPIITHKIADTTTTIGAADPDDLPKSITAMDEILADTNTHIASLTYHDAAGAAWYAGHKTDDVTRLIEAADMGLGDLAAGYVLYAELKLDLIAHAASTTHHAAAVSVLTLPATPNSELLLVAATNALRLALVAHFDSTAAHSAADSINSSLVAGTAADAVNTAGCRTNLNLYKAYLNSHFLIGDTTHDDLPAVVTSANAAKTAILAHMADATVAHGGTADAVNYATLFAVPDATALASAITLVHALKDTYNAHCAIVDGGAYVTAGPVGLPIDWPCSAPFWAKTDTSAGVFTVTEWTGW